MIFTLSKNIKDVDNYTSCDLLASHWLVTVRWVLIMASDWWDVIT